MATLYQVIFNSSLLVIIMTIHGFGMYKVMHRFEIHWTEYVLEKNEIKRQLFFASLISIMLLTHLIEIGVWASILKLLNAIPNFHTALYFAGETYTTVGFGDFLLSPHWRLISTFIAISGFFSFGWTTGVLVGLVLRTYDAHFLHIRNIENKP